MNRLITCICAYVLILLLTGCGLPSGPGELSLPGNSHPPNGTIIREENVMINLEQLISAQVLLVSATGQIVDGNTIITSENIDSYRPSEETVRCVSQYFRNRGFEVSPLVGISFAISASAQHFSDVFQVSLTEDETNGIQVVIGSDTPRSELPLASLDDEIADLIISVTFAPPPDFGPTSYSF